MYPQHKGCGNRPRTRYSRGDAHVAPLVTKLKDRKRQMGVIYTAEEGEQFDKRIKCLGDLPSEILIDVFAANSDLSVEVLLKMRDKDPSTITDILHLWVQVSVGYRTPEESIVKNVVLRWLKARSIDLGNPFVS